MAIQFAHLRFYCLAKQSIVLPPFSGSTLRGVFGHGLRGISCRKTGEDNCLDCEFSAECPYSIIFENPIPREKRILGIEHAPHPFIIYPIPKHHRMIQARTTFRFEMILLGPAILLWEAIWHGWILAGSIGLGVKQTRFEIMQVEDRIGQSIFVRNNTQLGQLRVAEITGNQLLQKAELLYVKTVTPLRILQHGKMVNTPDKHILINAMRRRMDMLNLFHGDGQPLFDGDQIENELQQLDMYLDVQARKMNRKSNRQQKRIPINGIEGLFVLRNPGPAITTLVHQAGVFNVGKSAALGMGRLSVEAQYVSNLN
jgi:CRISPR/Cas system endoribonuclease Cas6 (RAMP superfamily)